MIVVLFNYDKFDGEVYFTCFGLDITFFWVNLVQDIEIAC